MAVKTNTDYNDFTFNRSKHTNAKWIERSFFSSWTVLLILPTNCINMNEHPNLSNEEYSCWNKQYSHSNQQYKLQKVNLGTTAQNVNQTKVTDTWPLHCLTKHLNQVSYGHRSYECNLSNCVYVEAWKSQDVSGVWTHDLAILVQRSNQLSYEATDVGSWSFVSSYEPVRNGCEVIHEIYIDIILKYILI